MYKSTADYIPGAEETEPETEPEPSPSPTDELEPTSTSPTDELAPTSTSPTEPTSTSGCAVNIKAIPSLALAIGSVLIVAIPYIIMHHCTFN